MMWISTREQEIKDDLQIERNEYDHYNNLVVAATGAHTIILTSQKDSRVGNFWTCLFYLGEILSGEEVA